MSCHKGKGTCCGSGTVIITNYPVSVHQCTILAITSCLTCVLPHHIHFVMSDVGHFVVLKSKDCENLGCTNYQSFIFWD